VPLKQPGQVLRVVLVAPERVESWAAAAAKHIADGTATRVVGIVTVSDEPEQEGSSRARLPGWWFRLLGRPRSARQVRFGWCGPRAPVNRAAELLEALAADAAVWLGSGVLDSHVERRVSGVVPHGILSLRVGGRSVSAISGVEEVMAETRLTIAELVRTDRSGVVTTLRSGRYRTILGWPSRNRDVVLDAIATWPELELRAIALGLGSPAEEPPTAPSAAIRRIGIVSVLRIARQGIQMRLRALLRHDEWNVGVIEGVAAEAVIHGLPAIAWLPRRRGHYLADPFVVRDGASTHLFVEDYRYQSGRGRISRVEISPSGSPGPARPVLTANGHLSYPYLLKTPDGLALIPESSSANRVDIYRTSSFPDGWRRAATLLDLPASDSTILWFGDRWWLLATLSGPREDAELWIWHAPRLEGPWTPHVRNPVKVDVRSSRPGGTPFRLNGALYRPAQDSSCRYGGRLTINRVDVLTETDFRETPLAVIAPDASGPYPDGLHTVSIADGIVVVDGLRTTFSVAEFVRAIARNLRIGGGPQ
jgi:hypothetical protein